MIPQQLAFIEQKPKKVITAPTWKDLAGLSNDPAHARTLLHIKKCIENGSPLTSGYYSKGAGARPDLVLQTYGIMHLHLGKWNTNELLWVVQFPDRVVWLELSNHAPFGTKPAGSGLSVYHRAIISAGGKIVTPVQGQAGGAKGTGPAGSTSPQTPKVIGRISIRPKKPPDKADT